MYDSIYNIQTTYKVATNDEINLPRIFKRAKIKFTKYLTSQGFKKFRYESLPLICFCTQSCVIAWKMQDEQDKIRRKIVVNKSQKEEDVERENKYQLAHLSEDHDFSNIPILDVEPGYKYKISGFDDDDDEKYQVPVYDGLDDMTNKDMQDITDNFDKKSKDFQAKVEKEIEERPSKAVRHDQLKDEIHSSISKRQDKISPDQKSKYTSYDTATPNSSNISNSKEGTGKKPKQVNSPIVNPRIKDLSMRKSID